MHFAQSMLAPNLINSIINANLNAYFSGLFLTNGALVVLLVVKESENVKFIAKYF